MEVAKSVNRMRPQILEVREKKMRVLVSFDKHHYAYGDAIARAIEGCRPHFFVSVTRSEAFDAEVSRLRPDVVISDRPQEAGKAAACPSAGTF